MDSKLKFNICPTKQNLLTESIQGRYRLFLNNELIMDRKCILPPGATKQEIYFSSVLEENNWFLMQNIGKNPIEIQKIFVNNKEVKINWQEQKGQGTGEFKYEN